MRLRPSLISVGILLALGVRSAPPPVLAQAVAPAANPLVTLKGLVNTCQDRGPASQLSCASYTTGFVAGSEATQSALAINAVADAVVSGKIAPDEAALETAVTQMRERSRPFCIRSTWAAGQLTNAIVQYGRDHPEALEELASDHMLRILTKAFPCDSAPKAGAKRR